MAAAWSRCGIGAGKGEQQAAEGKPAGFRAYGKSKDHRDDLPQIVIGVAVTRDGIPVRIWCWPGSAGDSALIRQVKDDMRDWTLSHIAWVADRGFTSAKNRRYLRQGDPQYIIGEKLRSGSAEARRRRWSCWGCARKPAVRASDLARPNDLVGARHRAPPGTSENSAVMVTGVMYVRCNSVLGHKSRAFSPVRHPLEHAAVGSPPPRRFHWPAWSSGASSARMGGKSPARALPDRRLLRRPCRPQRGWSCRPPRGEGAVTAQPLAPVIPTSAVPAGQADCGPSAAAGPPPTPLVDSVKLE